MVLAGSSAEVNRIGSGRGPCMVLAGSSAEVNRNGSGRGPCMVLAGSSAKVNRNGSGRGPCMGTQLIHVICTYVTSISLSSKILIHKFHRLNNSLCETCALLFLLKNCMKRHMKGLHV